MTSLKTANKSLFLQFWLWFIKYIKHCDVNTVFKTAVEHSPTDFSQIFRREVNIRKIKGIVSVTSRDNDVNVWFTKLCLIKCALDINVFVSLNDLFSLAVSLRKRLFESEKQRYLPHFNRLRFQGYCWKSGTAIFSWRTNSNTWFC